MSEQNQELIKELIQGWNLNRGLIVFNDSFIPSKKPFLDGRIDFKPSFEEPLVFVSKKCQETTDVGDSPWEQLKTSYPIYSILCDDGSPETLFYPHEDDISILFPIAEITYDVDPSLYTL
ncbi:7878_t:CDS:1, partial [Cetraspora pellucida]